MSPSFEFFQIQIIASRLQVARFVFASLYQENIFAPVEFSYENSYVAHVMFTLPKPCTSASLFRVHTDYRILGKALVRLVSVG